VLSRLITPPANLTRVVLMLQKEVGARLAAGAGGRGLGAPAVLLRQLWTVERLFEVGTGAFLPAPDVVSVVLRMTRREGATLEEGVRDAVNRAYRQRRKTLRKTLAGAGADEAGWARALTRLGHPETARPEDLDPDDWPKLLRLVREGRA
jgi:16S rRNA (adenine1518-N6/adenine1519-N6)-dimethyltransferase